MTVFRYLALSVCVHVLIVSMVMGNPQNDLPPLPMLKVNLIPHAAPVSQPTSRKQASIPAAIDGSAPRPSQAFPEVVITKPAFSHASPAGEALITQDLSGWHKTPITQVDSTSADDGEQPTQVLIHKANYRRQIPPVYPRRALELRQEGTVTLHAQVTSAGRAGKLKVAESSGYQLLDKAALATVKKWEFEPPDGEGNTLASWVRIPVRFIILH